MNEDFVNFEIAKKLKEKGFRGKCLAHYFQEELSQNICQFRGVAMDDLLMSYNSLSEVKDLYPNYKDVIDAPTISQVLKWLREEKKYHITIDIWGRTWGYDIIELTSGYSAHWAAYEKEINTYEEAALAGIDYTLDNLI